MPARRASTQQRVLHESKSARLLLYLAVAAGFMTAVCAVAQAYLLSDVVDRIFARRQGLNDVQLLLALLIALAFLRAAVIWGGDVLAQRSASQLKSSLRQRLTHHIFDLGPAYTTGESSGELVHATVQGVEELDEYITVYQPVRLLAGLVPVFVVLVVFALDPPTTLVLLFTGPMLVLLLALVGSRTRDVTERRFRELSWMSAFFLDMLQGMATLKLFGRSREQIENMRAISRHYGNTTMEVLQTAFQTALVLEFGGTVATALVAVEVSLRLMAGTLSFNHALAVLVITPEFFLPLRQFAIRYHAGATGKAAAERIFAILDKPLHSNSKYVEAEVGRALCPAPPSRQMTPGTMPGLQPAMPARLDIRFEDVHLAYGDGRRHALQGFSLHIPERRTVALVGATGAGKTSVANLLLRFVDPQAGAITVGGMPLSAIDVAEWRSHLAWAPQRPHLFHGSIADNISLALPDAPREQIIAAARAAHAHEFIQALPLGYDTAIGEEGARLSGGQQQRIAIARAFLKDAPIVILDEATSSLDSESEIAIHDALTRLMQGRTVLIIAHRLRLVYSADMVVVMDGGRVVETGDHRSLLAQHGLYEEIVASYEGGEA